MQFWVNFEVKFNNQYSQRHYKKIKKRRNVGRLESIILFDAVIDNENNAILRVTKVPKVPKNAKSKVYF